jgi:hypothetical protein
MMAWYQQDKQALNVDLVDFGEEEKCFEAAEERDMRETVEETDKEQDELEAELRTWLSSSDQLKVSWIRRGVKRSPGGRKRRRPGSRWRRGDGIGTKNDGNIRTGQRRTCRL